VEKMKRNDFEDFVRTPEYFTVGEATNATDWAKSQFWTWHLHNPGHSVKPYDGLDLMLLMAWVINKFSGLDELPFALRYWDLRTPNFMVDEDDNLLAYGPSVMQADSAKVSLTGTTCLQFPSNCQQFLSQTPSGVRIRCVCWTTITINSSTLS
jgi:hypothetical protein